MPRLTDSRIASLKPKASRYEVWDDDGRGFGVRVGHGGSKSFILVYHFQGKPRRLTLGTYPKTGIADAHIAAGRARKLLDQGLDPGKSAVAEREAERRAETVEQLCCDYLERYAKPRKRSAAEDERLLVREVRPHWGSRKAKDVSRRDVVRLLDGIVDRGSPVTANRTLAVVRRMFNFAIERGIIEQSPCFKVKAPHREKPRERVLTPDEIAAFWHALDRSGMEVNIRQALRLLLVTGQRRAEIIGLREAEIDMSNVWAVPASRSKTGRERLIPLTPLAVRVIAAAEKPSAKSGSDAEGQPAAENPGWLLPSARTERPYQGRSVDHAVRDLFKNRGRDAKKQKKDADQKSPVLAGHKPFTPHDLRRTVATAMRELGVSRDDVRLVLGHLDRSVTGRVYDKWEGLPEKRRALDLWAGRLSEIISGKPPASNVTELKRA